MGLELLRGWQRLDGVHGFYGAGNQPCRFHAGGLQCEIERRPVIDTGCGSPASCLKHFIPCRVWRHGRRLKEVKAVERDGSKVLVSYVVANRKRGLFSEGDCSFKEIPCVLVIGALQGLPLCVHYSSRPMLGRFAGLYVLTGGCLRSRCRMRGNCHVAVSQREKGWTAVWVSAVPWQATTT